MMPAFHRRKAEKVTRTILGLDPATDHEMIIDGTMIAASQWINYALHRAGITRTEFDIMHAYFVTGFERQYYALCASPVLIDSLEAIETIRPQHVRGMAKTGPAAARKTLAILANLKKTALKIGKVQRAYRTAGQTR
ncbi:MAG: hypothetical protein EXQ90_03985 [Rhodospirillales bacterium]|nr:hypothetical protein [Rhodospirillales bacterium]